MKSKRPRSQNKKTIKLRRKQKTLRQHGIVSFPVVLFNTNRKSKKNRHLGRGPPATYIDYPLTEQQNADMEEHNKLSPPSPPSPPATYIEHPQTMEERKQQYADMEAHYKLPSPQATYKFPLPPATYKLPSPPTGKPRIKPTRKPMRKPTLEELYAAVANQRK